MTTKPRPKAKNLTVRRMPDPTSTPIFDAVVMELPRPPRSDNSWEFTVKEAERRRAADIAKSQK